MEVEGYLPDLSNRAAELKKLKKEGHKVIGYLQGGYMPEELVYACGGTLIPVGLIRGGEHEPVLAAGGYLPRWLDTFCRAQVGYRILQKEALYQLLDLLVAPITDNNIRAVADALDFYTDLEVFRFGVPHSKTDRGFEYYLDGIKLFKAKLEEITGIEITEAKLREAVALFNKERELLSKISLLRKAEQAPISGKDFARLNHASFLVDKNAMVEVLESLCAELRQTQALVSKGPRILLTGSSLALGDYKIYEMIEEAGGIVVIEEFAEGMRHYWEKVALNGDLMEALAERYFRKRVPPAWFRPNKERPEFLVKLARDYRVDGVIWYQLMYRDSYDVESRYFGDILEKETGLTMLKIESDYDASEAGNLRTRIETYLETIK